MTHPLWHLLPALVLAATGLAARSEPLKLRPGLWETTTVTEKSGAHKPGNLDQLTPEQRAKVEAQLAARAKKESHVVRSCMSESQLRSAEAFLGRGRQHGCTRQIETQTAGELVARLECRGGANPMQGRVEMHAVDERTLRGRAEMTYGAADRMQLLTRSEISARWLGAQCAAPAKPSGH